MLWENLERILTHEKKKPSDIMNCHLGLTNYGSLKYSLTDGIIEKKKMLIQKKIDAAKE
jgi:hypothetical protein